MRAVTRSFAFLCALLLASPSYALQAKSFLLNPPKEAMMMPSKGSKSASFAIPRAKESGFMAMPNQAKFFHINRGGLTIAFKAQKPEPIMGEDVPEEVVEGLGWPIASEEAQWISSPFGWRDHPVTKERAFHEGVDIAAAEGTAVRATSAGIVAGVGEHPRLGRYVKIIHADDPEVYSLYGHLKLWNVKQGEKIRLGQKIGEVGSTGRSTGPHLDYSLRRNGEAMDPLKHLTVPSKLKALEISSAK